MMPAQPEDSAPHDFSSSAATTALATAPARRQEQLLIELLPQLGGGSLLTTTVGYAQLARAAAAIDPLRSIYCWFLDQYQCDLARAAAADIVDGAGKLRLECSADFSPEIFAAAALPLSSHGEGELARELLQTAHERLALGGTLIATSDNPDDTWLGEQLERLFDKVARKPANEAVAYLATKTSPLKKLKNYRAEFAFRDNGRLIRAVSRPGVFAHRRIDAGARQLLAALEVKAGDRVLEIGCGSGTVSLAAALRAEGVSVHAVDSCPRAIECVAQGAALNGLSNVTWELNAHGPYRESGSYQTVLANPPYYGQYQVAERFLRAGSHALAKGGKMLLVTKAPEWYDEHAHAWLGDLELEQSKEYWIVRGRKPG